MYISITASTEKTSESSNINHEKRFGEIQVFFCKDFINRIGQCYPELVEGSPISKVNLEIWL